MRVLVVEDNALIAMELCDELADAGYEVLGPAANSTAAYKLIDASQPDVAFIDLDLTDGLTGPDIAARLRDQDDCFIVLASGDAQRDEDLAHSCDAVLPKPYMPADATKTVQAVADDRAGRTPDWPIALRRTTR